ncbi:BadF/BadG/BcrA/BcrD ATPase family protein [Enterococcus sp. C76]|uniref:BadF/BadG/BcrA/BcrD ATPase family protein n=1 Tax=Enterococcus sp. C76 TaxID=3231334 RepID=UPI0034A08B04
MALINRLKGNDGVLIISGTGSVGYGLQHATFYRVGGWGHILGDEGSAYSIGLACYKQLANELDVG